jgi:hypothetical protein
MSRNRGFKSNDSRILPYSVARGDALLQDVFNDPQTIRHAIELLAQRCGRIAYTPEVTQRLEEILQRRYDTDDGKYTFALPNYALLEDPEQAAFYGATTSTDTELLQTKLESFQSTIDRIVRASVDEILMEIPGIVEVQAQYANEGWARYGVAEEAPFVHTDPDVTLFRNYKREDWSSMSRPIATSDKNNVIDLYAAQGENVFATPHEGWVIDRKQGFFSTLNSSSASGF